MNALRIKRRHSHMAAAVAAATIAVGVAGAGASYADSGSNYLSVLNQERASKGIAPLHMSADLVRVAHSWALEMARTGVLRHNPRLRSQVPNWWAVGENVGDGPDMADLAQAFWNSPEHRANILDRHYTDVGISAVRAHGLIWIAVVFRDPWHEAAPASQQRRAPESTAPASRPRGIFEALTQRALAAFPRHWTALAGMPA